MKMAPAQPPVSDAQARINAFKNRTRLEPATPAPKRFEFDETKPLTLKSEPFIYTEGEPLILLPEKPEK
jgi:hypothetical protein